MNTSVAEHQPQYRQRKKARSPANCPEIRKWMDAGWVLFTYFLFNNVFDKSARIVVFAGEDVSGIVESQGFTQEVRERTPMIGVVHPPAAVGAVSELAELLKPKGYAAHSLDLQEA